MVCFIKLLGCSSDDIAKASLAGSADEAWDIALGSMTGSAPIDSMKSSDVFSQIYNRNVAKLVEPGFFDVVAHGSPTRSSLEHGSQISANELVRRFVGSGYKGGPIRLCSCSTGANAIGDVHGFAQALANKLRTTVRGSLACYMFIKGPLVERGLRLIPMLRVILESGLISHRTKS